MRASKSSLFCRNLPKTRSVFPRTSWFSCTDAFILTISSFQGASTGFARLCSSSAHADFIFAASETMESTSGQGESEVPERKEVTVKPIVYGNMSTSLGKKREEDGHTHTWTVYLRPYDNEDMSIWVKKVQFVLHETFPNRIRNITQPPYEVTETGWGEFDLVIKLFPNDPEYAEPVTLLHHVKLFASKGDTVQNKNGKSTLVSEVYDEIVFTNPSPMMAQLLNTTRPLVLGSYKHETDFEDQKEKMRKAIEGAQERVDKETQQLRTKLKLIRDAMAFARNAIDGLPSK